MELRGHERVMDAGCGSGRVTELLLSRVPGGEVVAVDAVFSNATFHWITDHDALFRNLAAATVPGAQLEAQCRGQGNIASIETALREMGQDVGSVFFASPQDTTDRLVAAGFGDVRTWLHDEPTEFEAGEPFKTFLATMVLRLRLEQLPQAERQGFVREVVRRLPGPVIDYVRLNFTARRA